MLNYAPDGMAAGGSALGGQTWSVPWEFGHLPHGNLIYRMLAASGMAVVVADTPKQAAFQPERMSGFCAAG